MTKEWSNLAKIVYKRTYARTLDEKTETKETWKQTVERVIKGNIEVVRPEFLLPNEANRLEHLLLNRKAGPAGRGLWMSGAPIHDKLGGTSLNNCWFVLSDEYENFVTALNLLMLGGGVGMSVEHKYVSKLPQIKKDVVIVNDNSKSADYIVPDTREGWCALTRKILKSFFVTGKSFSYSTICIRGAGEPIKGFGGKSSGPIPLITFVNKITELLQSREGKKLKPLHAADLLCAVGEMVVAGNVRRSAIIILGDCWDKEYLRAKRYDLSTPIPTQRAMANFSIVCEDVEDVHPAFWKTYEHGEPFGIVNRANMQKFGRMGEELSDTAVGVNPCVTGDTPILTKQGYVPIENVVNEEIEVWNGEVWSKVTPEITGTDQTILEVEFSNGRKLKCTPYHKFYISTDYKGNSKAVEAKDLTIGTKIIKCDFPILEEGKEAPLDEMYTQGFYEADGDSSSTAIALYADKIDLAAHLVGGFCNNKEQVTSTGCKKRVFRVGCELRSKGWIPHNYSIQARLAWLAGLLDGDGCELKEGGVQLVSINKEFLLDLQLLLNTCGVDSKVIKADESGYRKLPDGIGGYKSYWCKENTRICIAAEAVQKLKTLGMNCKRLKLNKSPNRNAERFPTVVSISERAEKEQFVYCFNEPLNHKGVFNGILTGQCGEATLESYEPCNLQEICLPALDDEKEFVESARLMHRYGKRVCMDTYHHPRIEEVVHRNMRVGTGITGCLESKLFTAPVLDRVYTELQKENKAYAKQLKVNESIRTTVIKPSGTISKVFDCLEGIHPVYSRWMIQRMRIAANDPLVPLLKAAGHHVEPVRRTDGTPDHTTLVVDFYQAWGEGVPTGDGMSTWDQLETVKFAQKHWADQAVSVTVYYKKEEIAQLKEWLRKNLSSIKTVSFLCHSDHGFDQAPKEAITKEQYEKLSSKISPISIEDIKGNDIEDLASCEGGACPIK